MNTYEYILSKRILISLLNNFDLMEQGNKQDMYLFVCLPLINVTYPFSSFINTPLATIKNHVTNFQHYRFNHFDDLIGI